MATTQRRRHSSHLAEGKTEARRNANRITNGAVVGTEQEHGCQGGGRLGGRDGFTSVLQTVPCGQLPPPLEGERCSVQRRI